MLFKDTRVSDAILYGESVGWRLHPTTDQIIFARRRTELLGWSYSRHLQARDLHNRAARLFVTEPAK